MAWQLLILPEEAFWDDLILNQRLPASVMLSLPGEEIPVIPPEEWGQSMAKSPGEEPGGGFGTTPMKKRDLFRGSS